MLSHRGKVGERDLTKKDFCDLTCIAHEFGIVKQEMSFTAVDAGSGRAKTGVKRNLFGTVDHDQIRDDLHRELKLITDEKRRKWNFDFENFQPLRGRYKWERVGKRLQTRKSPTEITPTVASACTGDGSAENVCQQRSVDSAQATARYNLRTRDRELENIAGLSFEPIDPARTRLRELGAAPVEYRNTGELYNV